MTSLNIKTVFPALLIVFFSIQSGAFGQYSDIDNAIAQEKFDKALQLIRDKLAADPKNDALHYRRGKAYLLLGESVTATEAFRQAVSYGPRNPKNFTGLAASLATRKDFDGTKENVDKALELNREDATAIYIEAADAYLAGADAKFLQEAETILYKIRSKEPRNKQALFTLGNMYFVQGVNTLAISNFREVVGLDDNYLECWMKLGEVLMREKQWQEALDAFTRVKELNPEYAPAKKWLGELEFKRNNIEQATAYYEEYVAATENDVAALIRYSSFLYVSGQCQKAVPVMENVLKDSVSVIMLRLLGYCNCQMQKGEEALNYLTRYFAIIPPSNILASDYENRGMAYSLMKNDSMAIPDFSKAIGMDSGKTSLYRDIAKLYFDKKDYKPAADYYSRFIATGDPKFRDYFSWANSYYFDDDLVNADTSFGKICEKFPTIYIGFHFRGRVNAKLDSGNVNWSGRPHYQKSYDILIAEENPDDRKKKDLAEACNYLAYSHYAESENCGLAVPFYQKYLELEPEGANSKGAKQVIEFCKNK